MNRILAQQLAVDFCTDTQSVISRKNVFTEYHALDGRRIFKEGECLLKAASVNGKILATGRSGIISRVKERFADGSGAWFMDTESLHALEEVTGLIVSQAHLFFIADKKTSPRAGDYEIRVFTGNEILEFRDDGRLNEAFLFEKLPKDEIGVGAYKNDVLLGMAGATSDSSAMWQIGINVMPEAEGLGIASMLVEIIKNEILDRGRLPFYGTALSHIASQRVALKAGFLPAWAELTCESKQASV